MSVISCYSPVDIARQASVYQLFCKNIMEMEYLVEIGDELQMSGCKKVAAACIQLHFNLIVSLQTPLKPSTLESKTTSDSGEFK